MLQGTISPSRLTEYFCCRRYEGETSSESGASSGDGKEEAEEAPPPLAAPDLFDAVAEEWQRLRLAMQDVY
jgi:hypothetical protein